MKKLIVINQDNAREAYNNATGELKAQIAKEFGISEKITDRIKTFEDALNESGETIVSFMRRTAWDTPDEIAYKKAKVITKVLNEGWEPNWDDSSEKKWRPWFPLDAPGFRFGVSLYGDTTSYWAGGSRLCFKSEDLCNYAAQQFFEIYKDLYL
jgi:hypothetical protein